MRSSQTRYNNCDNIPFQVLNLLGNDILCLYNTQIHRLYKFDLSDCLATRSIYNIAFMQITRILLYSR